jgi:UDP-N-acetyl-2-amino-2-deoxyglucuronate dehydrogenase
MSADKKVIFAIVGFGYIGRRHYEMVMANPESEVGAIVDINPAVETFCKEKGIPYFPSLESFLAAELQSVVDVVTISTPNGLHASQALLCLESKKHIVIEKPMSLHKLDAERIIFKALDVHRHVFVVMQNRYSPPSQWLKGIVDSGKLGRINLVQLNCYWNRDDRYYKKGGWHGTADLDGGVLYTQFSHFIDILYWVFGDIVKIQKRATNFNHKESTDFDDSGLITFEFVNGGMGALNFSTSVWDKNLESSLTVLGENGALKIGGQYMNEVEYCHIKDYTMPELAQTNPGNDYGAYKGSAANHNFVIQNVIDVLNGRDSITTNALEGLKVVDIIERIYKNE